MDPAVFEQVTGAWREMSKVPLGFAEPGATTVAAVATSLICPPGWCGYVRLGDRVVMTAPDPERAAQLSEAIFRDSPDQVRMGPAVLAYLDRPVRAVAAAEHAGERAVADAAPGSGPKFTVAPKPPGDPLVADLEGAVDPADAAEAGVGECLSPVFVALDGSRPVAAAGYRPWVNELAHMSVLTRTGYRGRGLAGLVSAAAVAHAQAAGLIPQWRARTDNLASRAVAARLGFTEIGEQISRLLAPSDSALPAG